MYSLSLSIPRAPLASHTHYASQVLDQPPECLDFGPGQQHQLSGVTTYYFLTSGPHTLSALTGFWE